MYVITTFYKFLPLTEQEVEHLQGTLLALGEELDLLGLILVAKEGVNGTVASSRSSIDKLTETLLSLCGEMQFKESSASKPPFPRMKVKIKDEIVAIGNPELIPPAPVNRHLSPSEFNDMLENHKEEIILLDTRNTYETDIGKFRNALTPPLDKFNEFPKYVESANLPKDKTILMYCTGGIRCEKAILEMQKNGYENVYQLQGGILKYLEEFPNKHFDGECFVFDHRVAVQQDLSPSETFKLCPHCGDPGSSKIVCKNCGASSTICEDCKKAEKNQTCSKNCRYHFVRRIKNESSTTTCP
ncbi:MAG: hypothetical protein KDD53_03895 [Bdellovibrionales bacterium]|nr:hypothetical protein [Bdellovibrionales bacterium]